MDVRLTKGEQKKAQEILEAKRFGSVEWYTNTYQWLGFIKEVCDLKKVQMILESIVSNRYLKAKDKVSVLSFIYPEFEARTKVVADMYRKKNKKFDFECKPMMSMIWRM